MSIILNLLKQRWSLIMLVLPKQQPSSYFFLQRKQ
nr:MAG TPA: hypothetical protein [Caudoviricetes sp.]